MFCPKCSQEQVSENNRFCSRCGFLLTGIAEVVENGGLIPNAAGQKNKQISTPRKKGVKKGFFILVLAILMSPILMIIAKELNLRPAIFILAMFILLTIGIVRMIYAKLFESNEADEDISNQTDFDTAQRLFSGKRSQNVLPPKADSFSGFVSPKQGSWRDSNELVFSNISAETTKQLNKE